MAVSAVTRYFQSSAAGGNTPGSGQIAYYQAFFRDGAPGYCTAERTNASNGVQVAW